MIDAVSKLFRHHHVVLELDVKKKKKKKSGHPVEKKKDMGDCVPVPFCKPQCCLKTVAQHQKSRWPLLLDKVQLGHRSVRGCWHNLLARGEGP